MKYLSFVLFTTSAFNLVGGAQIVKDGKQKTGKIIDAPQQLARSITSKVVIVHDGETINVLDKGERRHKIRYSASKRWDSNSPLERSLGNSFPN